MLEQERKRSAEAESSSEELETRVRTKPRTRPRAPILAGQTESLSRALGWFSIGLGTTELLAPRRLGRTIGVGGNHALLFRTLALREITSGIGILRLRRAPSWTSARVVGDAVDLALLGGAAIDAIKAPRRRFLRPARKRKHLGRIALASTAVLGVTALDVYCAQRLGRARREKLSLSHGIIIARPAAELYRFWRDFSNLPKVMRHLHSVSAMNGSRSHWVAKMAGKRLEWDAEITEEKPNERLSWRTLEKADVPNHGTLALTELPEGRGTLVHVEMRYAPPGGRIGKAVARMLGDDPARQIKEDLRRFKQLMETGELKATEDEPSVRRSILSRLLP